MRLILTSFERLLKKVQEQKNKCFTEIHIFSLKASMRLSFNAFKPSQDSIAAYNPSQCNEGTGMDKIFSTSSNFYVK